MTDPDVVVRAILEIADEIKCARCGLPRELHRRTLAGQWCDFDAALSVLAIEVERAARSDYRRILRALGRLRPSS